ncbi:DUF3618 domain-containing protein [Pseudomonas fulva]|nr:DUF3618 domain-containing protein [Pseudomonas fulva]MBF8780496.1 DUF3618 domain-containing protein [Pseudomonas fulva]
MSPSFEHESQKNPDDLEQEINAKREHISDLVDAIEQRLTPGQLFDQVMSYTKGNGGEFVHNLGLTLKNNPVPTALTAVGLAWLAVNQNRPFNPGPAHHGPGLGEKLSGAVDTVKGALSQASDKLHDASSSVKAKAYDLRDKASDMTQGTRDSASSTADSLRRTAHDTRDQVRYQADMVKGQFDTLLREQPLVLAAIGIALGAAIGAALPSTRKEDQLLGSASDRLTETVKAKGERAYVEAKETVKQSVSDQGSGQQDKSQGQGRPATGTATDHDTDLSSGLGFPSEDAKP